MGCDIHLFVERKIATGWENVPPPADWNGQELDRSGVVPHWSEWFGDRNYELYAWLADVRNRHDQPILAEPRGLPADASPDVRLDWRRWDGDAHSCTWYALAELPRDFTVKHGGIVDEKLYLEWKAKGEDYPGSWCQGTSQPVVSEAAYLAGQRPELPPPPRDQYGFGIRCEWELPAEKAFKRFFKFIDAAKLEAGGDARIVLWFDN